MHDWHVAHGAEMMTVGPWLRPRIYARPGETVEQAYVREARAVRAGVGMVETPVELTVRDGHLTDATGPEGATLLELLTMHGEDGTNIAELGIGTNEEAALTGNILEDEKILGTAHIAFGASAAIGGNVQVPVHLDCVITEPTVAIDGEEIVRGGNLLL